MSGRTAEEPVSLLDDDDVDSAAYDTLNSAAYAKDEVDVQIYGDEEGSDDDLSFRDFAGEGLGFADRIPEFEAPPTEFEVPSLTLDCGEIRPGHIVELEDHTDRKAGRMISGDFLLVRSIVENMQDGEVVLRGYRMRRCAYLQPTFEGKLNDIFLLINVSEHDQRPRFVQGLEDVHPEQVVQQRKCVFTNLTWHLMNARHASTHPACLKTANEVKEWVFYHGKLVCRYVYITETHTTGQSCGGERRRMSKREAIAFRDNGPLVPLLLGVSKKTPPAVLVLSDESGSKDHEAETNIQKWLHHLPQKARVLTLGDGFCGCGGVSEGARRAGFRVLWGLEKDPLAMKAYRKNFPEALAIEEDAHDFAAKVQRYKHGCDHLHMSCPCCFWSKAHTIDGKNDEANMMTLYTVEAWLGAVKPSTFSLEQADGLLTLRKHSMYFRYLIRSIALQGYNVRWRIQDQAWFGLAQHRRRLIFVGSKIGIPLPPFPAPTHGPPGSGLKRYVTIEDSLKLIDRQSRTLRADPYHQPHLEKRTNAKAVDPHVSLAKCITTSGGDNTHYSGKRTYTVRELASFQGIRPDFRFFGSVSEAKKQCGNVWPPGSNIAYFRLWAAHREAFDHGFLDAEDEVLDLYDVLEAKGIPIPKAPVVDVDMFHAQARRMGNPEPEFRYLPRLEKTVKPKLPLQIWAKYKNIDPLPQRQRKEHAIASHIVDRANGGRENRNVDTTAALRHTALCKDCRCMPVFIDNEVEPTWIDERV